MQILPVSNLICWPSFNHIRIVLSADAVTTLELFMKIAAHTAASCPLKVLKEFLATFKFQNFAVISHDALKKELSSTPFDSTQTVN